MADKWHCDSICLLKLYSGKQKGQGALYYISAYDASKEICLQRVLPIKAIMWGNKDSISVQVEMILKM